MRSSFLRARIQLRDDIEAADRSYDIFKIRDVLRRGGFGGDGFDVVERAEVARDTHLVARGRRVELEHGVRGDHLVFAETHKGSWDCWAYVIDDARLSFDVTRPGQPEMYVFDGRGRLVNGLFFGASPFLEPPRVHFDRPAVFADDFFVNFNICHLLFDKLPRHVQGRRLEPSAVGLLFHTNNYTAALASVMGGVLFGLSEAGTRGTISAKRLIVFSNSFVGLSHPLQNGAPSHVGVIEELREACARIDPDRASAGLGRVMIDRNGARARRLVNQADLEPELRRRGFAMLDAGAISPVDQMSRFAHTGTLMGVHGAGLANLAFMPADSEVIELFPQMSATRAYALASQYLGHRYRYLVLPDPDLGWVSTEGVEPGGQNHRRDVVAPPELLLPFLDGEEPGPADR